LDDHKQFYDDEIDGVMLIYVNQFMIYDPEKIMLGNMRFIQEKIIEKREGSGILFDIHQFQLPALLVPILFDHHRKLDKFVHEARGKKQSPQQIHDPHNIHQSEGMGGSPSALRGKIPGPCIFGGQKGGGNVDERDDKR
jgi:hypothetical protein